MSMPEAILSIRNLRVGFGPPGSEVPVVEGVDLDVVPGEIIGIVGESGSGKSTLALSILRLLPPSGRIIGGTVEFEGENILTRSPAEMNAIRGDKIAMIFQEPMTALNPVFTIGDQIAEALHIHRGISRRPGRQAAIELLDMVEIPNATRRINDYPHQLSGGMRQRVMIAMAIACRPRVLIADEPTTALDVTVQAQIFNLLAMLQREMHLAIVLITHDLGVIAQFAHRVLVMYAGRVVEQAPTRELFHRSRHPYTRALLNSLPERQTRASRLYAIPGTAPTLNEMPRGCRFAPRCDYAVAACVASEPPTLQYGAASVACIRAEEIGGLTRESAG
jgi:oligopeptide/dipeptide ABC transporter ATP-binding protein